MWTYIFSIIGLACVGVLWINSEPTTAFRYKLFKWWFGCRDYSHNIWWKLLNCCMCSTFHIFFWWQLITTGEFDILGASIASVLGELISRQLNKGGI